MNISVEISMYPLTDNYIEPISNFINILNTFSTIKVRTNGMSTQIYGEYDLVMKALTDSMKVGMQTEKVVFVTKFLGTDVSEYQAETDTKLKLKR